MLTSIYNVLYALQRRNYSSWALARLFRGLGGLSTLPLSGSFFTSRVLSFEWSTCRRAQQSTAPWLSFPHTAHLCVYRHPLSTHPRSRWKNVHNVAYLVPSFDLRFSVFFSPRVFNTSVAQRSLSFSLNVWSNRNLSSSIVLWP